MNEDPAISSSLLVHRVVSNAAEHDGEEIRGGIEDFSVELKPRPLEEKMGTVLSQQIDQLGLSRCAVETNRSDARCFQHAVEARVRPLEDERALEGTSESAGA